MIYIYGYIYIYVYIYMHISYLSQTCEFTYLVDVSQKSLNPPRGLQDGMKRRKALLSQQQVLQKTLESMQSYQEKLSKAESHLKETKVKLDKSCWAIFGVIAWGGALWGTVKHMWLPAYSPQKIVGNQLDFQIEFPDH